MPRDAIQLEAQDTDDAAQAGQLEEENPAPGPVAPGKGRVVGEPLAGGQADEAEHSEDPVDQVQRSNVTEEGFAQPRDHTSAEEKVSEQPAVAVLRREVRLLVGGVVALVLAALGEALREDAHEARAERHGAQADVQVVPHPGSLLIAGGAHQQLRLAHAQEQAQRGVQGVVGGPPQLQAEALAGQDHRDQEQQEVAQELDDNCIKLECQDAVDDRPGELVDHQVLATRA